MKPFFSGPIYQAFVDSAGPVISRHLKGNLIDIGGITNGLQSAYAAAIRAAAESSAGGSVDELPLVVVALTEESERAKADLLAERKLRQDAEAEVAVVLGADEARAIFAGAERKP